ncbi:hypothetical protein HDU96_004784 [Phlyctochytrium bullatum]|nr:hypothetical protein HDU96_004784 [Phlyctochytrium bullatum]
MYADVVNIDGESTQNAVDCFNGLEVVEFLEKVDVDAEFFTGESSIEVGDRLGFAGVMDAGRVILGKLYNLVINGVETFEELELVVLCEEAVGAVKFAEFVNNQVRLSLVELVFYGGADTGEDKAEGS